MLLFTLTEKTASQKTALVDSQETLTYQELKKRCEHLAYLLSVRYGIGKGHKVAFFCKNHASFVQGIFAASRLGADSYLLHCSMGQSQFNRLVQEHQFDLLIYDDAFSGMIEKSPYKNAKIVSDHEKHESINSLLNSAFHHKTKLPAASSGKIVLLTGGTTGKPKQVIHRPSLFHFLEPFAALLNRLKLPTYSTAYIATPIYHGYGIAILLSFLALGKKVVIQENFDAKRACDLIRQHQVEVVTVVPLMIHKMLKHEPEALRSLACIASGGAKLHPVLVNEVNNRLGNVLYNLYGTSEAGLNIIATPEDLKYDANTLGKRIPGGDLKVVKDGVEVEPGSIGEFCIRNKWSMKNRKSRWIHTGDIGYRDGNGYYFLCGRTDDLIISAGNNIYPGEIETVLRNHPSVEDVAVIGVEDVYAGHILKACVQLYAEQKMTEEELLSWLRTRVAHYQLPRELVFVEELPYTAVGKLDRKRIQAIHRR
ncbi:class I adenylate-forming enzyme family protein [Exiguobacterium algae]|uniref:class I adenylate-forming enzyme family protein n=1 Tax=Exiguobacterium algae TaxID=2751250 RepID=UPI001F0A117F|nr:AMP-binding protein [Exiguobacterium algae]